ncbi:MAG: flagellar assembly protein FliW [Desulfobulbaceae bacterium]|nr:flagellar assembly protein FliW [Desulfobulbaceae bacterium]HIJ78650.1 flagellar assembly protein FliW [Deltaproteobacteria bacterium]
MADQQTTENILTFPNGILGFEECKHHTFHHQENGSKTLYWLQPVDKPEVAFCLVDPANHGLNYDFTLSDDEQALIKASTDDEIAIFLMLARCNKQDGTTEDTDLVANISGPLVVNISRRLGIQKVLPKMDYSVNLQEN